MLVFPNKGLMPLEAATTFGLNVKLNENPIGFFGTGFKYAIAVTLRLGGRFRLFLGRTEYEFYTAQEDFRGKEFGMIRMRKRKGWHLPWMEEKLGYTTELGKHWEPWMAVRELESNCRDEGGMGSFWEENGEHADDELNAIFIEDGHTVIAIECPEMEDAFQEEVIFLPENKELIDEIGPVQIFRGESNHIFYRGLRVTDLGNKSMFTYNFTEGVTLTEDRTSKYAYVDQATIMACIQSSTKTEILEAIMDSEEEKTYEASMPWDEGWHQPSVSFDALLSVRALSGGPLPKRMLSYWEAKNKADEVDPYIDVKMSRSEIEHVIDVLEGQETEFDSSELVERLRNAL